MKNYCHASAVIALGSALFLSPVHAASDFLEDFQGTPTPAKSGNEITNSPLFFFDSDREIDSNVGRTGNFAYDAGNGGAIGHGTLDTVSNPDVYGSLSTISSSAEFSMLVGIGLPGGNGVNTITNNGGSAGFGWTKATSSFSEYNGGGTGVTGTDHFSLSLYKISGSGADETNFPLTFGLTWANGLSQASNSTNAFQEQLGGVELSSGKFYRLHGTLDYNAGTETFSFSLALDDWGDGSGLVTANLLTGSDTATVSNFGDQGQTVFYANSSRGASHLDDISFAVIPEPGTLVLMMVGGFCSLFLLRGRN